jgi:hypothetical protein
MRVHHLVMRKLSWLFLAAFFFLNPGFACGPGEAEYQYGAAEMRAAIEGDWALTIMPTSDTATELQVTIKQATSAAASASLAPELAFVRPAHACGDRTLLASANACISTTTMPLAVSVSPGGTAISGTLTGTFSVLGTTFGQGHLTLTLGERNVSATLAPDGTVLSATLSGFAGPVNLRRLP